MRWSIRALAPASLLFPLNPSPSPPEYRGRREPEDFDCGLAPQHECTGRGEFPSLKEKETKAIKALPPSAFILASSGLGRFDYRVSRCACASLVAVARQRLGGSLALPGRSRFLAGASGFHFILITGLLAGASGCYGVAAKFAGLTGHVSGTDPRAMV